MKEVTLSVEDQIKEMIKNNLNGYFTIIVKPGNNISISDFKLGEPNDISESLWAVFNITNYSIGE